MLASFSTWISPSQPEGLHIVWNILNNFGLMMDRVSPLLPALVDPAMASCTSLNSLNSVNEESRRPSGSSLVARPARMSNVTRQKSVQQVLHSYKHDHHAGSHLRRRPPTSSAAPTSWSRDQSGPGTNGRSNRDSLEMSLDAWNMDSTNKAIQDRRHNRKRDSHMSSYTVTIPFNQAASSLDSPQTRTNGEGVLPFVLPPGNTATVTPTKAAPQSFFSGMFSSQGSPRPQPPRTPTSTSPARPSTVRRIARTLLEWNLGPQTDLSKWQRDSPQATRDPRRNQDELMEDNLMRTPD
ncbi:hypothetical protein FRC14_003683 [Serendipita sp. 396]|nr:hypothetical protein FRC14_003683 [Serendipita sp. 396]KAG8775238.1 hypothetical protein FRC15_000691 [Serendipita sp. 397]KAG8815179.1 hypothetical protein FRC18_001609 [Serendipita sp. 400]KAG9054751.1 hypothetical protein FS842_004246 [Serendipita sp. 407]